MLTTAQVNAMLDAGFVTGDKMSLHTAYSATGTNEVTGGSYAKQSLTFGAAATRAKAVTGNVDFPVPSSTTIAWIGIWNTDLTVFKGMWPNGGAEFSYQLDVVTNNRIISEGHGLANNDRVIFTGATVPAGLTAGTAYHVIGVTAADPDYFNVSATQGGAAIDITGLPSHDSKFSKIVLETYTDAGTHRVSAFSINM